MPLTASQRRVMEQIINVFESGTVDGDYAMVVVYSDGPNNVKQVTYGRAQTTEYGNLPRLLEDYCNAPGALFVDGLRPYLEEIGTRPLAGDAAFKKLLKEAGRKDPVMRSVQDRFFDEVYFKPAAKWARDHGFEEALSILVIYDSFIHSGGILDFLRKRFPEVPPSKGGDARAWTDQYVAARDAWLRNNTNRPILQKTVYRTECFRREIARDNWDLTRLPINANGTAVT